MTHVTCRLTAKNQDQLRNPTLGNRVWATFTFFYFFCYLVDSVLRFYFYVTCFMLMFVINCMSVCVACTAVVLVLSVREYSEAQQGSWWKWVAFLADRGSRTWQPTPQCRVLATEPVVGWALSSGKYTSVQRHSQDFQEVRRTVESFLRQHGEEISQRFWCVRSNTHTYTDTRLTTLFPGLPGWADTRKVKPVWILLKQETANGNGIRPDALPAAQLTASKHWRQKASVINRCVKLFHCDVVVVMCIHEQPQC